MRNNRINLWLVLADGISALVAAWAAAGPGPGTRLPLVSLFEWSSTSWLLALMLAWVLICDRMLLGQFHSHLSELVARIVVATAMAGITAVLLNQACRAPFPGFRLSVFLTIFLANVGVVRLTLRAIRLRRHFSTSKSHRAVIIGYGPLAQELAIALHQDPTRRHQMVGVLAPEMEEMAGLFPDLDTESTVPTIGISEYLVKLSVDQAYIALPNNAAPDVVKLVAECRAAGIAVSFVPSAYDLRITRSVLRHIGGIPLVAVDERQRHETVSRWKITADAFVAALLLLIMAPLLGIVAVVLRRTRSRAFRCEARCGLGGRPFQMYRFNIERHDLSASGFEKWLEITSISELPQLLNVLRGEMSLVGPRPEAAERLCHYSEWQKQRLEYRPGITGYAQLQGLRERDTTADKARHDIRYPLGWSPMLDLTIILQTLWIISSRVASGVLSPSRSNIETQVTPVRLTEVSGAYMSKSGAD
jgi:putative colanic acid biosynthesis UDP-glucose lipid carrier transferase